MSKLKQPLFIFNKQIWSRVQRSWKFVSSHVIGQHLMGGSDPAVEGTSIVTFWGDGLVSWRALADSCHIDWILAPQISQKLQDVFFHGILEGSFKLRALLKDRVEPREKSYHKKLIIGLIFFIFFLSNLRLLDIHVVCGGDVQRVHAQLYGYRCTLAHSIGSHFCLCEETTSLEVIYIPLIKSFRSHIHSPHQILYQQGAESHIIRKRRVDQLLGEKERHW